MADYQKFLISVLGAVLGHLLLFLLLGVLFTLANIFAPARGEAAAAVARVPEEVTILLSDLMDQVEVAPRELTQQYMRTDADQETEVAPEDAPFHSDKNTQLTSERLPDANQPDQMPSVNGRTDLPFVEIRDRELVDGEFLDASAASRPSPELAAAPALQAMPTAAQAQNQSGKPTPPRDLSEIDAETEKKSPADPADQPREPLELKQYIPATADAPPETVADRESQPDALTITDTPMLAQRAESFDSAFAADPVRQEELARADQEAASKKQADVADAPAAMAPPEAASARPLAQPLVLPSPQDMAAASPSVSPSSPNSASPNLPPSPKPPSDTPAFNPHTRATEMEGGADNVGNTAAFDVEASVLGKYKKAVTEAVERKWHRYREQNADFVTYGTLKVKFRVDKKGTPRNLRLMKNDANSVMAEFTLRAVLDADIPPMPEEVSSMLGPAGLEINYDVIVY